MQQEGLLIVISAPSGAGKTTLCNGLVNRFPGLKESISYTTRKPRAGERDGVDYHFVSVERFRQMIADDGFVEWAEVHGNLYGTALATVERACRDGIDLLLDIDCQGARSLKDHGVPGLFIFVMPPSMAELRRRLEARSSDAAEVIERRLVRAVEEMREAHWYDYIIVNDRLEDARQALESIVVAARQATGRMWPQMSKMFDL